MDTGSEENSEFEDALETVHENQLDHSDPSCDHSGDQLMDSSTIEDPALPEPQSFEEQRLAVISSINEGAQILMEDPSTDTPHDIPPSSPSARGPTHDNDDTTEPIGDITTSESSVEEDPDHSTGNTGGIESTFVMVDTTQILDASSYEESGVFYGAGVDNRTIVPRGHTPTPPPESGDDALTSEDVTNELLSTPPRRTNTRQSTGRQRVDSNELTTPSSSLRVHPSSHRSVSYVHTMSLNNATLATVD